MVVGDGVGVVRGGGGGKVPAEIEVAKGAELGACGRGGGGSLDGLRGEDDGGVPGSGD